MAFRLRGRQVQIDTMAGQLDGLLAGRGGIILVRGLPGMGKSSLLAEAARMADNPNAAAATCTRPPRKVPAAESTPSRRPPRKLRAST